jgi:luciferase family oxidoreductase group 1
VGCTSTEGKQSAEREWTIRMTSADRHALDWRCHSRYSNMVSGQILSGTNTRQWQAGLTEYRCPPQRLDVVNLSVLDLVPVRTDQTSRDALAVSIRLAELADRLGYRRFWTAEHHNTSFMASTSPAVMIAYLAAVTTRIRLGSGGVMLPNHSPLIVAEQFALLEAVAPGRIDLGIGRAAGSDDQLALAALRGTRAEAGATDSFAQNVDDVAAILTAEGMHRVLGEKHGSLAATPAAISAPPIWLLGSSASSAQLAAEKGLPYVFAHHFGRGGTQEALERYRAHFVPGLNLQPVTILTVCAIVAPSAAEADALSLPMMRLMTKAFSNELTGRVELVEDALGAPPVQSSAAAEAFRSRAIIGTPDEAADQMLSLAARFDVDEVMVCPMVSERCGTSPVTAPAREMTLELLAKKLLKPSV